jgi:DNA-binding winged helix-turn-helix (wHTH) protein
MSKRLTFGRMSRTLKLNFVVTAAIATAGLLAMQTATQHNSEKEERQFSERVNLALRQTAHQLLTLAGDRTGGIPPVEQTEPGTWFVQLEENFDYDSLPPILQKAFSRHHVEGEYNVAVVDCDKGELMLGYAFNPATPNNDIACGGRDQTAGCYNLRVTFFDHAAVPQQGKRVWILLGTLGAAILAFAASPLLSFLKKKDLSDEKTISSSPSNDGTSIQFGLSSLQPENQKLVVNGVAKDLTYRETKLLQLFCRHANQLLERDLILKSVWEDEGIIVGRSVDVFVSRLRKLLKEDNTVNIANVHGVGYRLEISQA